MKLVRVVSTALLAALAVMLGAGVASAAAAARVPPQGFVRVLQGWTDAPTVTVSVDGAQRWGPLAVGTFSERVSVAAGSRRLVVASRSGPSIAADVVVEPGLYTTVLLLGPDHAPPVVVVADTLRAVGPGQASLRFLNIAADVPSAELMVSSGPRISGVSFGSVSAYVAVTAGGAAVDVSRAGDKVPFDHLSVAMAPGSATTVALVGGGERPVGLIAVSDGTGLDVDPLGFPPTGGGGLAAAAGRDGIGPTVVLLVLCGPILAWAVTHRRQRAWTAAVALAALLAGCSAPGPTADPVAKGGSSTLQPQTVAPSSTVLEVRPPHRPNRVTLPDGKGGGPVEVIALQGPQEPHPGWFRSPATAGVAGWYGGVPGAAGLAVFIGHIDLSGLPGVFELLSQLRPGDLVTVGFDDGQTLAFVVNRIETYPKVPFPNDEVYAPTSMSELRLISCIGTLGPDRHYTQNVVAYASLAPDGAGDLSGRALVA